MENSSYFIASRHKLSAFFSLIFRFSSCHHPLLASALAKIMQDEGNRVVVGKDENAVRQLISMISSDNQHVVCQLIHCRTLQPNFLFNQCIKLCFCSGRTSLLCSFFSCHRRVCGDAVDEIRYYATNRKSTKICWS